MEDTAFQGYGRLIFPVDIDIDRSLKLKDVSSILPWYSTSVIVRSCNWGISYILNTVRSFCLGNKNDFLKGRRMCCVLCILQVTTLLFTWSGWWSLLLGIANIAATIGGFYGNFHFSLWMEKYGFF